MLLHDFLHLTYDYNNLIDYLCDMQVLRREIVCPRCQQIVHLRYTSKSLIFQCTNHYYKQVRGRKRVRKICSFSISPFSGTWFSQSRLGIVKICRFIAYFLVMQPPRQTFLKQQLGMSSASVVDWTNFCRELLAQWVKNEKNLLGGPEIIVEVDEAEHLFKEQYTFNERIPEFFKIMASLYPLASTSTNK